jgi:hypothetical protein
MYYNNKVNNNKVNNNKVNIKRHLGCIFTLLFCEINQLKYHWHY